MTPTTEHASWRDRYKAVLASPHWKALKRRLLTECDGRCERCGIRAALELHHETYERLGRERDEDVELVCGRCHEIADEERAARSQERARAALYDARLDGWARKVYGEDWEFGDVDAIEEEFEVWADGRDDY